MKPTYFNLTSKMLMKHGNTFTRWELAREYFYKMGIEVGARVSNRLRIPLPFNQTMEAALKVKPEPKRPKKTAIPKRKVAQKA
jgi:hypothetical protein